MNLNKEYLGHIADFIEAIDNAAGLHNVRFCGAIDVIDHEGNRLGTLDFDPNAETTLCA